MASLRPHFGDAGARHHLPQLGLGRFAFGAADQPVKVEGLDEGVALQQRLGEVVELAARDRVHRGKQLVGDGDHFDRFVEPLADGGHAHRGALLEGERVFVVFEPGHGQRQQRGGAQASAEGERRRDGERERQATTQHFLFPNRRRRRPRAAPIAALVCHKMMKIGNAIDR
nr:hypothetical protein [Massilia frigida]